MSRSFSPATAEQVIAVIDAVVAKGRAADPKFVANFSDLTENQAEKALKLAEDLGFLSPTGQSYVVASPLCLFAATPRDKQKASLLRIALESYEPFLVFRERLVATASVSDATEQTKALLDLNADREEIKDTLVSLGTYSFAIVPEGGGRYRPREEAFENTLKELSDASGDFTAAEARIRKQLGADAAGLVSRDEVIVPLANGLLKAEAQDPRGAVVRTGNAIESYLDGLAARLNVVLTGATGVNAKLERLSQQNKLAKKLVHMGKYLGHIRNAADHGNDPDVGAPWTIRNSTGLEYVYVACSFVAAATAQEKGQPPEI